MSDLGEFYKNNKGLCDKAYLKVLHEECDARGKIIDRLEKQVEVLKNAIEYAISGISHSDSKTECRHCALKEAIEKYNELKEQSKE